MRELSAFIFGALISAVLFFIFWKIQCKRIRNRTNAMVEYLEDASYGKETALVRIEDEFSILEDEISKTVGELRIAREHAQAERIQQADNLADISHQLKTPLTSMSLMVQLLSGNASSSQIEYIQRIENQLTRLEWLTNSLLTMSRLDAGAVEFSCVYLNFEDIVIRALETLETQISSRGQNISIIGGHTEILCDPHWTAEALVNVIKNCSEHTPYGGSVTLESMVTPIYTQIIIKDTGAGFDAADIANVFRRFYRGKNAHKESIGIGLALCRAIIEGQGGIIRAENSPDGGARFIIRFYQNNDYAKINV